MVGRHSVRGQRSPMLRIARQLLIALAPVLVVIVLFVMPEREKRQKVENELIEMRATANVQSTVIVQSEAIVNQQATSVVLSQSTAEAHSTAMVKLQSIANDQSIRLANIESTATAIIKTNPILRFTQWSLFFDEPFATNENGWEARESNGEFLRVNMLIDNDKYRWDAKATKKGVRRSSPTLT